MEQKVEVANLDQCREPRGQGKDGEEGLRVGRKQNWELCHIQALFPHSFLWSGAIQIRGIEIGGTDLIQIIG